VRVSVDELQRITNDVANAGRRYSGDDLVGALIDCDYGLEAGGFASPEIQRTDDLRRMVVYRSRPDWEPESTDEVVARLEECWLAQGAFRNEAHAIAVKYGRVLFDFVTWWESGEFYTGRIDVGLPAQLESGD